ncbi:uncharacterized protein KY384_005136 [Bacidia gigantensis]|uniref:uncharacterized protein n=1 Tax=Bacidia gigantensis TaxID=2732470 RepID=UPI001D05825D|nr:uncharacterized protein KY384_005136 [Bacidia gigantensis]KAG8529655.1 hypothetical protein KY384_005136 [Bacidia gigantensis]
MDFLRGSKSSFKFHTSADRPYCRLVEPRKILELAVVREGDVAPLEGGDFKHNNTTPPSSKSISALLSNHGKTAIVTGAGAGIGLAVAEALAESGANVAIWYHGNRKAIQRAREIEVKYGVKCKAYVSDIRQYAPVERLIDTVLDDFNGRLDIFVANAGIPWKEGTFLDGSVEHYRNVMATDLDSVFYCARAAGRIWRRQKEEGSDCFGRFFGGAGGVEFKAGSFIATTSMSAHIVNVPQLQAAYNAAKAGVIQLVKSVAVEMVQFARANTVSPGYILTEISDYVPEETKKIWRGKTPMG